MIKEHCFGEAVVSSRRNHDIEEQETGVELVSKLPRIMSIANHAQEGASAKGKLYSTALNCHEERHSSLRRRQGSISMGRCYKLTNSTPPRR